MKLTKEKLKEIIKEILDSTKFNLPSDLRKQISRNIDVDSRTAVGKEQSDYDHEGDDWAHAESEAFDVHYYVGELKQPVFVKRKRGDLTANVGWYISSHGIFKSLGGDIVGGPFKTEEEARQFALSEFRLVPSNEEDYD